MPKTKPGPKRGLKHNEVKRSPFGMRLFNTRKARGLTQQQLGEKCGVTKRVIAFYEGDSQGPPVDLLKRFSEALTVTTSYLLGESPQKLIKEEIRPVLRKHLEKLQKLSPKEQKKVVEYTDLLTSANGKH
jgi:transcriptional regulator with XRE-family HTH domain